MSPDSEIRRETEELIYNPPKRRVVDGEVYVLTKTTNINGRIAHSYHPVLTPEEKAKREDELHRAAARFLRHKLEVEARKEEKEKVRFDTFSKE